MMMTTSRRPRASQFPARDWRSTGMAKTSVSRASSSERSSQRIRFSKRTRLEERFWASLRNRRVGNGMTTVRRRWKRCSTSGIERATRPQRKIGLRKTSIAVPGE